MQTYQIAEAWTKVEQRIASSTTPLSRNYHFHCPSDKCLFDYSSRRSQDLFLAIKHDPLELMKMTKSQSWVMKKLRIMCVNPHQLFVKKTLSDSVLFFCNDGEKWHFHKFQRNIHLPIPLSENVIRRVEFSIICTAVFCGIFNFNLLKEEK